MSQRRLSKATPAARFSLWTYRQTIVAHAKGQTDTSRIFTSVVEFVWRFTWSPQRANTPLDCAARLGVLKALAALDPLRGLAALTEASVSPIWQLRVGHGKSINKGASPPSVGPRVVTWGWPFLPAAVSRAATSPIVAA